MAANVLAWGTGALNIDGCRIGAEGGVRAERVGEASVSTYGDGINGGGYERIPNLGRWPANVALGHTPDCDVIHEGRGEIRLEGPCAPGCPVAELDRQSGVSSSNVRPPTGRDTRGIPNTSSQMVMRVNDTTERGHADTGGASRFFYVAKAPTSERPRYNKSVLRLRAGLTPEQVGHVRARLAEAGVRVD